MDPETLWPSSPPRRASAMAARPAPPCGRTARPAPPAVMEEWMAPSGGRAPTARRRGHEERGPSWPLRSRPGHRSPLRGFILAFIPGPGRAGVDQGVLYAAGPRAGAGNRSLRSYGSPRRGARQRATWVHRPSDPGVRRRHDRRRPRREVHGVPLLAPAPPGDAQRRLIQYILRCPRARSSDGCPHLRRRQLPRAAARRRRVGKVRDGASAVEDELDGAGLAEGWTGVVEPGEGAGALGISRWMNRAAPAPRWNCHYSREIRRSRDGRRDRGRFRHPRGTPQARNRRAEPPRRSAGLCYARRP